MIHQKDFVIIIIAALILSPHSDDLAAKLYLASRDQEVLELLQRGAPPNSDYYTKEQGGLTPLHNACARNHLRSAELLIKFGAIVAATANDGWTPLHWACANDSKAPAKLLLEHQYPTGEPTSVSPSAVSVGVCHLVQVCGSGSIVAVSQ